MHALSFVCPECRAGKHGNCDGYAWDDQLDEPTACSCDVALHPTSDALRVTRHGSRWIEPCRARSSGTIDHTRAYWTHAQRRGKEEQQMRRRLIASLFAAALSVAAVAAPAVAGPHRAPTSFDWCC